MFCYAATLLPLLLVASAVAKSSRKYGSRSGDRRVSDSSLNAEIDARYFVAPEDSTLPPVVTSAAWRHSPSADDDQKKTGSAPRWNNEIVRQLPGERGAPTNVSAVAGSEPEKRRIAAYEKNRSSTDGTGATSGKYATPPAPQRRRYKDQNIRAQRQDFDGVASTQAMPVEQSNDDASDENKDENEPFYDDDEDYDVVDDDYDDDEIYEDDIDDQYDDDDADLNPVDELHNENGAEKAVTEKESIGREGITYQEYELSADASNGIDYDATNAEVVNELQVVRRRQQRRRRKGAINKTKKRKRRRRKRPPVEPVGRVKRPTQTRRRTNSVQRRRTTKKRRRKTNGQRRRKPRKNRRNKQTTSLSFDFGGDNRNQNEFEQSYRRPEAAASTKPRRQQSSILQSLQQQYQQPRQDGNDNQYYVPRYVDVHAGQDRRRIVEATANVQQSAQRPATINHGSHAGVIGRVPPTENTNAHQTSPRPESTLLQRRYVDQQQYQRPQHPENQYYNHNRYQQPQQQQQQHQHSQLYHQPFYNQQPQPTYSRHQQQIHLIVPTADFDLRRIPQVMSALGLSDYISVAQPTAHGEEQVQFNYQQQSPNFGVYREGHPAVIDSVEKDLDDDQRQLSEGSRLASSDDVMRRHVRLQRSTSDDRGRASRLVDDEKDVVEEDRGSARRARRRNRAKADDEEYVDNSDVEITTRSPGPPTTPLRPR